MDLIEQINGHELLVLVELKELVVVDNALSIIVDEAREMSSLEKRAWDDVGGGDPIISDQNSHRYKIEFFDYVAYCVRNKSQRLNVPDAPGDQLFNSSSESAFLDFLRPTTFVSVEAFGPFTHHRINCVHHTIDVVCRDAPEISVLARA